MAHGFAIWGGPVATIIASITAAGVAGTFGYFQYQVARTQRDIAYEKLKFDLYSKRYAVFDFCKRALTRLIEPPPATLTLILEEGNEKLGALIREAESLESDFLFPQETLDFISEIIITLHDMHDLPFIKDVLDSEDQERQERRLFNIAHELDEKLYTVFKPELGFGQLRRSIAGPALPWRRRNPRKDPGVES